MPARGIHHVDLTVSDVVRSIDFYTRLLGPLGLDEYGRYPSYRGTEEVVYFNFGRQQFGLRPADGGEHRYYDVGIEHIAFTVDAREEVDDAYQRCLAHPASTDLKRGLDRRGELTTTVGLITEPIGNRTFCEPSGAPTAPAPAKGRSTVLPDGGRAPSDPGEARCSCQ